MPLEERARRLGFWFSKLLLARKKNGILMTTIREIAEALLHEMENQNRDNNKPKADVGYVLLSTDRSYKLMNILE